MNRGGPLRRTTGLASGASLKRSPMKRQRSTGIGVYAAELDALTPALHARSRGRCELHFTDVCKGKASHRHHRKLRGQGGTNTMANLLHLCTACHDYLHAHPRIAYSRGWLVPMGADPETWPVR